MSSDPGVNVERVPSQALADAAHLVLMQADLSDDQLSEYLGVDPWVLQSWLDRGRAGEPVYAVFWEQVKLARIKRPAELFREFREIASKPKRITKVKTDYAVEFDLETQSTKRTPVAEEVTVIEESPDWRPLLELIKMENPNLNPLRLGGSGAGAGGVINGDQARELAENMSDSKLADFFRDNAGAPQR